MLILYSSWGWQPQRSTESSSDFMACLPCHALWTVTPLVVMCLSKYSMHTTVFEKQTEFNWKVNAVKSNVKYLFCLIFKGIVKLKKVKTLIIDLNFYVNCFNVFPESLCGSVFWLIRKKIINIIYKSVYVCVCVYIYIYIYIYIYEEFRCKSL